MVSGGTGGLGVPTAYQNSDSDSSTTKSAVEKGELIIRNKEQQKQDINELSRDTESANNPLKQIFDKQKELDKIETVELIKDIAQQAKSVMNKYDRIQAQNEVDKNKDALSKLEAEKAYNKLSDEEKAKYKTVEDYYNQNKDYFYYVAVDEQLKTNRENNKNLGGMGSDVSKGIDSAISIVTGIITGNITGGLAGASAPWVAEQIKIQTGDNETARLISHAILGAVVAELQGNSGLAGGAGAVTGELAAKIIREQLYGKDVKDLTEAEKQNISALAQLATGLAVASAGGDVGDVSTGIAAGKNAVENNELQQNSGFDRNTNYEELFEKQLEDRKNKISQSVCVDGMSSQACASKVDEVIKKEFDSGVSQLINIATFAPFVGEADCIYIIWNGRNLAGEEVDKLWGYIGLLTFGYGQKVKMVDRFGNELASKGGKVSNKLDENSLGSEYGKGNVEQGGGNYKETKDKILDNQATNQKANESSKFGEHVKKEKEINAGKGTVNNISNLNPNEIRFSQNTVSYNKIERGTDMKYTYDDLVTNMKTNGWKGDPVDVIKMPDGKFTSMDNTRIAAAREAGINIKANVRNFNDKLSPSEVNRFSDPKKGFIPTTWGEAITGRINKQSGGFSKNNPFGSNTPPRISGKTKE